MKNVYVSYFKNAPSLKIKTNLKSHYILAQVLEIFFECFPMVQVEIFF